MNLVVLGLSLSSSWGNGHAVTYRALLRAFAARGHDILFLERDAPWYAEHRDLTAPTYCRLEFYQDPGDLRRWTPEIAQADAIIIGSYVPGIADWVMDIATAPVAFYDIDTPVTLAALDRNDCTYLTAPQIARYDLYLSFTGGPTLDRLEQTLQSPAARALYCSADPTEYQPTNAPKRWDLSYLGTYSPDRQPALESLLLEPARRSPHRRFAVAGPQYPGDIAWPANVERLDHVPPAAHPDFYGASRFTLNITRADMIAAGYSPSIRLFEAAACATPILSDIWPGIATILTPAEEIILVPNTAAVLDALQMDESTRQTLAAAARHRILQSHTPAHRAETLEQELQAILERKAPRQTPHQAIGKTNPASTTP